MLFKIRKIINELNLDGIIINSTNEFLVEYNSLEENSRYKLTGFSGSTGDALVTRDNVYLFVDGRYHIQADNEVNHQVTTVVKLYNGETMLSKLVDFLPQNAKLGIVAKKNSQLRVEKLQTNFGLIFLDEDCYGEPVSEYPEDIIVLDEKLSGKSVDAKLNILRNLLTDKDAILVTLAEDVSYLFNKRDFSRPYSSKILRRAIITKKDAKLYSKEDFDEYKQDLLNIEGKIYIDKASINARDFELIKGKAVELPAKNSFNVNVLTKMKSVKTDAEINHYMDCFERTDKAMRAIRDYIFSNENLSEYDICTKLEEYFKYYGAINLSFKSIVAKDKNSALAHYSKSSKNEIIKDGSLILIDCGAYYEGGLATDITRVFVKGQANELQKKVYTTVLRANLLAYNSEMREDVSGFDIDSSVREFFNKNQIEGFVFNHGLGHGIGINVHEYPPNLSCNEQAKFPLEDNMCFTIEPGLYNKDYFGVRLENSCYLKNGKIRSFTNMNFEKSLIDYTLLSDQEKEWLKDFEVL